MSTLDLRCLLEVDPVDRKRFVDIIQISALRHICVTKTHRRAKCTKSEDKSWIQKMDVRSGYTCTRLCFLVLYRRDIFDKHPRTHAGETCLTLMHLQFNDLRKNQSIRLLRLILYWRKRQDLAQATIPRHRRPPQLPPLPRGAPPR